MSPLIELLYVAAAVVLLIGAYCLRSALLVLPDARVVARTFKFRFPTEILTFEPNGVSLPQGADGFIAPMRKSLMELGFESSGYFTLPNALANVKTINLLMVNRRTIESAIVNCIYVEEGAEYALRNRHIEFVTRFRDGACLQTNNSGEIGSFASPPGDHTVQFWDLREAPELHRRHQRIAEYLSTSSKWLRLADEFGGDVQAYVSRAVLQEPLDYQVKVGRLRRVADGYVATPWGAYLMAWRLRFPWQNLIRLRTEWVANRWLARIGEA